MRPLGLLLLLAATVHAGDKPKLVTSPKERLESIQAESKAATAAYFKANEALPDTPEGTKKSGELDKAYDKDQAARFLAAVEIAKANSDSDVGLEALEWVLTISRSYYHPAGKAALELAAEKYAADPKIGKIIAWLGYYPPSENADSYKASYALIHAVAEKNLDRTARGQAELSLAWQAGKRFAVAEYKKSPDLEKLAGEAENAFQKVLDDYGDCYWLKGDGKKTLGEEAKQEILELRHLRVGKTAPDIEGENLDGTKFKLGDSNGKIRVVVYWASWCGPCMAMVPHEKKLVARLKDRPFVLLGVNGDEDLKKAKQAVADHEITWASFWNGPKGSAGPLARAWNVRLWPTIYVLDDRGVIRFKNPTPKELNVAVDELLEELDKKVKDRK